MREILACWISFSMICLSMSREPCICLARTPSKTSWNKNSMTNRSYSRAHICHTEHNDFTWTVRLIHSHIRKKMQAKIHLHKYKSCIMTGKAKPCSVYKFNTCQNRTTIADTVTCYNWLSRTLKVLGWGRLSKDVKNMQQNKEPTTRYKLLVHLFSVSDIKPNWSFYRDYKPVVYNMSPCLWNQEYPAQIENCQTTCKVRY